jgi:hypothetical protein
MNAIWHGAARAAEGVSRVDESRTEAIILGLDLTASYAGSAPEAAWRGGLDALENDQRPPRDQLVAVIANFRKLEPLRAQSGEGAPS